MSKLDKIADKLLEWIPGSVYGLISMAIGTGAILISLSLYPGYDMFTQFVSWLGVGPGLAGPFFNIGLILTGIIALPFFISLGKILKQEENGNQKLKERALNISIIGCVSLALIGCFPAFNTTMLIIHGIFAVVFFFAGLFLCILFSYLLLIDSRFSSGPVYSGFIVAGIFIAYMCTFQPIMEWLVLFSFGFWIIQIALYILHKKM